MLIILAPNINNWTALWSREGLQKGTYCIITGQSFSWWPEALPYIRKKHPHTPAASSSAAAHCFNAFHAAHTNTNQVTDAQAYIISINLFRHTQAHSLRVVDNILQLN